MKTLTLLTNSIFLLLCLIAIGSCNSIEDMNQAFETQAAGVLEEPPLPDDKYTPGKYKLPALITEPYYCIYVGQKTSFRIEVRSSGLRNYNYWLVDRSKNVLGLSVLNSDGERVMEGGLSSQNSVAYILPSATKAITSEDPENLNTQMAYTFICHAFNAFGDEYWDEALVHVIPVQAIEWYTTDGTLDGEGTNSNMITITDSAAAQLENEVGFNNIEDLKVWTDMGARLKPSTEFTFTSYTPGTLTIIVWNKDIKDAVQPTVTGKTHEATLRKYMHKNSMGITTYTIAFEGADTWTISNGTDSEINPIVYIKAQMSMKGAVE